MRSTGFSISIFILLSAGCSSVQQVSFPCLPATIKPTDVVSAERVGDRVLTVTVADRLKQLNARCEKGKLVDGNGKEIRFYKAECFGAPTAYAMETTKRQQAELDSLKEIYTVIEMTCEPTGAPRP